MLYPAELLAQGTNLSRCKATQPSGPTILRRDAAQLPHNAPRPRRGGAHTTARLLRMRRDEAQPRVVLVPIAQMAMEGIP